MKIIVSSNFYFNDANFINYLHNTFGESFDTEPITEIDCSGCNICSLKGIEVFSNLRKLLCNNNQITDLDLTSLHKLEELQCNNNQLSGLDLSLSFNLQLICCRDNNIKDVGNILLPPNYSGLQPIWQ